jgi:hypothetical protein
MFEIHAKWTIGRQMKHVQKNVDLKEFIESSRFEFN